MISFRSAVSFASATSKIMWQFTTTRIATCVFLLKDVRGVVRLPRSSQHKLRQRRNRQAQCPPQHTFRSTSCICKSISRRLCYWRGSSVHTGNRKWTLLLSAIAATRSLVRPFPYTSSIWNFLSGGFYKFFSWILMRPRWVKMIQSIIPNRSKTLASTDSVAAFFVGASFRSNFLLTVWIFTHCKITMRRMLSLKKLLKKKIAATANRQH